MAALWLPAKSERPKLIKYLPVVFRRTAFMRQEAGFSLKYFGFHLFTREYSPQMFQIQRSESAAAETGPPPLKPIPHPGGMGFIPRFLECSGFKVSARATDNDVGRESEAAGVVTPIQRRAPPLGRSLSD